jgi:2-hydroxy-6-oxonona-2,4-dienedioate hydrolase
MTLMQHRRSGTGDPLVLVHGYLGGSQQWAGEIEALKGHFDVIAVDLPGYGQSHQMTAPTEIAEHARAVLAHLDALGVSRFHLLGHSMGGMIVQEMVSQAPDRVDRLVLFATGPQGSIPGRFETMARSRERLAADGVEHTARRISAMWLLDKEASPQYEALAALACQASEQAALAGLWAMEGWDGRDRLAAVRQPTLVVWGDGDRSYGWPQIEALWRGIPKAALAVLPSCSHAAHLERPGLLHSILIDFLTAQAPTTTAQG